MSVRGWMTQHYRDSPMTKRVVRQAPRTVAWLRAARRTFPAFVAIVVASALVDLDVSQYVLAVTWPTLTVALLTMMDQAGGFESKNVNASRPAE